MNDTRKRGLFRLNFNLPEAIEAALFRPRLDKLTVERTPECECREHGRKCRCCDMTDEDL